MVPEVLGVDGPLTETPVLTVVCDGWIEPRHERKILRQGTSDEPVSHGMCDDCQRELLNQ